MPQPRSDDPRGAGAAEGAPQGERPGTGERPTTASAIALTLDASLGPLSARGPQEPEVTQPQTSGAKHLRPAARGAGAALVARRTAPKKVEGSLGGGGASESEADSSDDESESEEETVEFEFAVPAEEASKRQAAASEHAARTPVAKEPERAEGGSSLPPLAALLGAKAGDAANERPKSAGAPAPADPFGRAAGMEGASSRTSESTLMEDDEFGYAFDDDGGKREYAPQELSKKQKTLLTDVRAAGMAMDAFAEGEEEEGDYDDEGEEVKANDDPERVPEAAASAPAAAAEATEATASAPMPSQPAAPPRRLEPLVAPTPAPEIDAPKTARPSPMGSSSSLAASPPPAAQDEAPDGEWAAANAERAQESEDAAAAAALSADDDAGARSTAEPIASQDIPWSDARQYVREGGFVAAVEAQCVVEEPKGCLAALLAACLGPPALKLDLHDERLRLFALAKTPLDDADALHVALLATVYRQLMGKDSRFAVQRYGPHWDDVGFQGEDPSTDLRSAGVLGLVQMLDLAYNSRVNLATILDLARDEEHGFPFAVVSLNATKWALEALRAGGLNEEANRAGSVLKALGRAYAGGLYKLYQVWKGGGKTMQHSGFVLKEVQTWVSNNAGAAIDLGGPKTLLSIGSSGSSKPRPATKKASVRKAQPPPDGEYALGTESEFSVVM